MANTIGVLQAARLLAEWGDKDKITDLTPLKLQKILYYVEGWHLGFDEVHEELFSEPALAWKFGPVYKVLYNRFRGQEPSRIRGADLKDVDSINSTHLRNTIKAVWNVYKHKSARELVALTHETQPYQTAIENKLDDRISKSEMRGYFRTLAHET